MSGDRKAEMQLSTTLASFGTPETYSGLQRGPNDTDADLPLAIMGEPATVTEPGSTGFKDEITSSCPKSDDDKDDDKDDDDDEEIVRLAVSSPWLVLHQRQEHHQLYQTELIDDEDDGDDGDDNFDEAATGGVADDPTALDKELRKTKAGTARRNRRLCKVKRERLVNLARRLVAMEDVELSAELQANVFFMKKLKLKVAQLSGDWSQIKIGKRGRQNRAAALLSHAGLSIPAMPPMQQQYGSQYRSPLSYDPHGMAAGSVRVASYVDAR